MLSKSWESLSGVFQMLADAAWLALLNFMLIVFALLMETDQAKTQVQAANAGRDKARAAAEAADAAAGEAAKGKKKAEDENQNLRGQLDKLARRKIDILFLLDGSASMEPGRAAAIAAIRSVCQILPAVAGEVRVGCIFYVGDKHDFSEMITVAEPWKDRRNLEMVVDFMSSKPLTKGLVDNFAAIEAAIDKTNDVPGADRRQVIVHLTDAQFEEAKQLGKTQTVKDAVNAISGWKLFGSGEGIYLTFNPNPQSPAANKELAELAAAGGGVLCGDSNDLLEKLSQAALK
jgi:Mg-chelatase subunit ChlD